MNSKQKIMIDQQSSSSSPVIGHTDSMVQQPTLFDDQQQQQQQLRPIIVPPSTIPTTTTTTTTTTIKSSSSRKNDIEHFVSHDDRSLRKQQERDDMLLQKEKERMSRDRLNRNKDPVVVSISQKSSSNSATASAMKRIKKTIDRMRSLNQVESEKNRNQYESNDEGDEGDDNNYDSDAASDENDADGEYFDESIMIRRNKPTTEAAAEKAGTITEKAEKTSNENKRCKNTVSGHDLVTDSRGFTCFASDLSTRTMCCRQSTLYSNTLDESRVKQVEKQGQDDGEEKDSKQEEQEENKTITTEAKRYSCDTCHSQYQCCESYEYCVSCCLKPQNRPMIEQLHKKYLSQQKLLYTRIRTAFDFCAARCRTNSNSVVNENRYRTHWKHCFGAKDPADIFSSSSSR